MADVQLLRSRGSAWRKDEYTRVLMGQSKDDRCRIGKGKSYGHERRNIKSPREKRRAESRGRDVAGECVVMRERYGKGRRLWILQSTWSDNGRYYGWRRDGAKRGKGRGTDRDINTGKGKSLTVILCWEASFRQFREKTGRREVRRWSLDVTALPNRG